MAVENPDFIRHPDFFLLYIEHLFVYYNLFYNFAFAFGTQILS